MDMLNKRAELACFLEKFDYGEVATAAILKNLHMLMSDSETAKSLILHTERYKAEELDFDALNADARSAAERCGISEYESRLVFYLLLLLYSEPYYRRAGLDETVRYDSLLDFKWKMLECLDIYGVYGIFTTWMGKWFVAERAAFGRLEFDIAAAKTDYRSGDVEIKAGDPVVAVHIPSRSRYGFSAETCRESYRQAYEYYSKRLGTPLIFSCCSWMTWSKNSELLPASSRIREFASAFDVVADYDGSGHLWRIFGNSDTADIASLPEDTGLRRIYKAYMLENGTIGTGQGYFCYEHRFGSHSI